MIYDAKRLIGRKFNDADVQRDMKLYPFKVFKKGNKPVLHVEGHRWNLASDEDNLTSDEDSLASNEDGFASNEDDSASDKDDSASDKDDSASDKDDSASYKDDSASNQDDSTSDENGSTFNEDNSASHKESFSHSPDNGSQDNHEYSTIKNGNTESDSHEDKDPMTSDYSELSGSDDNDFSQLSGSDAATNSNSTNNQSPDHLERKIVQKLLAQGHKGSARDGVCGTRTFKIFHHPLCHPQYEHQSCHLIPKVLLLLKFKLVY
ncbi:hypothetical protein PtB15_6B712 [Puccinia triticina]|nr:hypothetical protein PtB15_6B712 [Puccinia triticina]